MRIPPSSFGDFADEYFKLFDAYWNTLKKPVDFVGMCLISAGIFGGDEHLDKLIGVGLLATYAYLKHERKVVMFASYTQLEQSAMAKVSNDFHAARSSDPSMEGFMRKYDYPDIMKAFFRNSLQNGPTEAAA